MGATHGDNRNNETMETYLCSRAFLFFWRLPVPFPRVLTIALLLKVIMHRVFTTTQWEALLLLILGITVNQLSAGLRPIPAPCDLRATWSGELH